MADTRDFRIRVVVESRDAQRQMRDLDSNFSKTQATIVTLNQALELGEKGLNLLRGAAERTFQALDQGQRINNVQQAFVQLNEKAGIVANDSLRKLQEATLGTVNAFDLMTAANRAVQLGLDPATFDQVSAAATKLALSMGGDARSAIDDVSVALGRQSKLVLDNLGIILKDDEAYQDLAISLGKTTEQLTFQDKAIFELNRKAESLGDITINAAVASQQARVAFDNLVASLLQGFTESTKLGDAFTSLTATIEGIDFRAVGRDIGDIAARVVEAADAVVQLGVNLKLLEASVDTSEISKNLAFQNQELLATVKNLESAERAYTIFKAGVAASEGAVKNINFQIAENNRVIEENQAEIDRLQRVGFTLQTSFREASEAVDVAEESNQQLNVRLKEQEAVLQSNRAGLRAATVQLQRFRGELDESSRLSKEARDALADLTKQYDQLQATVRLNSLKESLEEAAKAGNNINLEPLKEQIRETIRGAIVAGLDKSLDPNSPAVKEAIDRMTDILAGDTIKDAIQGANSFLKDQFEDSANFFSDVLFDAMNGTFRSFEEIGKRILADIAGGFLASVSDGFVGGGLSGIGQQIGGSIAGSIGLGRLLPGLGAGGAAAGILGIGAGGTVAGVGGGVGALATAPVAALGPLAIPALAAIGIGVGLDSLGVFDGGKDRDQQARDDIREFLQNNFGFGPNLTFQGAGGTLSLNQNQRGFGGIPGVDAQNFNVDFANPLAGGAVGLVQGLAAVVTGGGGKLKDDLAGIFTNAVLEGNNFNEVMVNTLGLMGALGINADQAKNELAALFLDGQIGLDEFAQGVENFNFLAREDLIGENGESVADALRILAENIEGAPRTALKALELAFKEMRQAGIDESSEIRAFLVDQFGPQVADTFAALAESGINSFTDFSQLSVDQISSLFQQIDGLAELIADALGGSFQSAEDSAAKSLGGIKSLLQDVGEEADRTKEKINNIGGKQIPLQPNPGPINSTPLTKSGINVGIGISA